MSMIINPFVLGAAPSSLLDGIAYYKLGEASGVRADSTLRGNDLTANGAPPNATGKVGSALSLTNTSSQYLSLADNADMSTGGTSFTICAWVNATSFPSNPGIVAKETDATHREYRLDWFGGNFRWITFDASGGAAVLNVGAGSAGTWYFIVAWYDVIANTLNAQINNGTVVSVTAGANAPTNTTAEFRIGVSITGTTSNHWNGLIDEVGVWKRLLAVGERGALYNGGSGSSHPFDGALAMIGASLAQLTMADAFAPMPKILNTLRVSMPLQQNANTFGWMISRDDIYQGTRIAPADFTDMTQVCAHLYPVLWDADTNTAWTGADNTGTKAASAQPGRSTITVTGIPISWLTLSGVVGSERNNTTIWHFTITNTDSSAHNVRFGLAGYAQCQASATYTFDAPTQSVGFVARNASSTQEFEALTLLNQAIATYTVGRTSLSFASGAFDNTASFSASAGTNYYSGVATGTLAIPAGGSVVIVAAMVGLGSFAAARAALPPASVTIDNVRAYWANVMTTLPIAPVALSETQRQAWYLAQYTLKVCEKSGAPTLYYASPMHYRDIWYWDACLGAMAAPISVNTIMDKSMIEFFLDTRMNQSTGFISHYTGSSVSQTPFLGRLAWEYYTRKAPGGAWLTTYYPKLKLQYDWWLANRKHATLHLFGPNATDEAADTLPIYDSTIPDACMQLTAVLYDYAVRMADLAAIAVPSDASYWSSEIAAILADSQNMWNATDSWFYPLTTGTTQRTMKTLDAFFAIWADLASGAQASAMATVISGSAFMGTYGVRSVANTEGTYAAGSYWRGPIWTSVNCLLAWGLHVNYGLTSLAQTILGKEITNVVSGFGDFIEMINPDTNAPGLGTGGVIAAPHNAMHAGCFVRALHAMYG